MTDNRHTPVSASPRSATAPQEVELQPVALNAIDPSRPQGQFDLQLIADVSVCLQVKLGEAQLSVGQLQAMQPQQVFPLDQQVDDPVQLMLNGKVIGLGKLVVVDDRFGIELIALNNR